MKHTEKMKKNRQMVYDMFYAGEPIRPCVPCNATGQLFEYDGWNNEWYEECRYCQGKGYIEVPKVNK